MVPLGKVIEGRKHGRKFYTLAVTVLSEIAGMVSVVWVHLYVVHPAHGKKIQQGKPYLTNFPNSCIFICIKDKKFIR